MRKFNILLTVFAAITLTISMSHCKKDESTEVPTVAIDSSTIRMGTSFVTMYGNVTGDGGSVVSVNGFCYSASELPTINSEVVITGSGTGLIKGTISGLNFGTTYYVRAYATNSEGTAYSAETDTIVPIQIKY